MKYFGPKGQCASVYSPFSISDFSSSSSFATNVRTYAAHLDLQDPSKSSKYNNNIYRMDTSLYLNNMLSRG